MSCVTLFGKEGSSLSSEMRHRLFVAQEGGKFYLDETKEDPTREQRGIVEAAGGEFVRPCAVDWDTGKVARGMADLDGLLARFDPKAGSGHSGQKGQ